MRLRLEDDGGHLSERVLARLATGEASPAEQQRSRAHLEGCAACRQALGQLEAFGRDFAQGHDRVAFLAAVRRRAERPTSRPAGWAWLRAPGPILASAAAALVVLLILAVVWTALRGSPTGQPGADGGLRTKGAGLDLGYLVMAHGRPVVARPGRVLHPGDRIQFRLSAPRGGFVYLVGVDQAGQVSVYYPPPGQPAEAFPGGSGRPVPGSVILDDTLGRERVFALLCDRPLDRDRLASEIRGLAADPRVWIERDRLPLECRQTSLVLVKER